MQMQQNASLRWVNVLLGIWLMASAMSWRHGHAQFLNTLAVGAACAIIASAARRTPALRYLNVALAIWLFVSTWMFPREVSLTVWNNTVAAIIMFVVALVPGKRGAAYVS